MKLTRRDVIGLALVAAASPVASRVLVTRQRASLPLDRGGFCVDVASFAGAARSITDYSGFGYCPAVDAMLLFGGGHAATPEDVVVRLPMSTLTWSADYQATPTAMMLTPTGGTAALDMKSTYPTIKPGDEGWPRYLTAGRFWQVPGQTPSIRPVSRHTYSGFVWSHAVKRMILPMGNNGTCYGFPNSTTSGNVGFYDPLDRSWVDTGKAGGPSAAAWCEDPVSGMLLAHFNAGFVVFDPREREFIRETHLNSIPHFGYGGNLVYYPPTDKFYYFARDVDPRTACSHVWEYALDRTAWAPRYTRPATNALYGQPMDTNWHPTPPSTDTRYVFDAAHRLIVGNIGHGLVCAFRPLADNTGEWYQQDAPGLEPTIFYCHQYAPTLDAHFSLTRTENGVRTFAFRWEPAKAVRCANPVPAVAATASPKRMKADGIAAMVGRDADLERHPDVLGYVDFSSADRVLADLGRSNWADRRHRAWYLQSTLVASTGTLPAGASFPVSDPEFIVDRGLPFMRFSGGNVNPRIIHAYLWAGPGVRHAFARYVLVIEPDVPLYMTELGVKLPGLAGEYEDTVVHPPHAGKVTFSWRMEHGPKDNLSVRDYLYDGTSGSGYGNIRDYDVLFPIGVPVVVEQELDVDRQQGRVWVDGVLVGNRTVVTDVDIEMLFLNIYHGGRKRSTKPIHYRLAAVCLARSYIGPPRELVASLEASPLTLPFAAHPPADGMPTSRYIRDNPRFGIHPKVIDNSPGTPR